MPRFTLQDILDNILHIAQHPVNSMRGTVNEFTNSMRVVHPSGGYVKQPEQSSQVVQPQGIQQMASQVQQAPPLYAQSYRQPGAPIKKKRLTPDEELRVTSQGGQLDILDQGY